MQAPFQKDEALLADIAAAQSRGASRLWWLGQSGFLLQSAGVRLLFDPYLSDSLTRKYQHTDKPHVRMTERVVDPGALREISLITSSHAHTDHFDPDTLVPLLDASRDAQLLVARANHQAASERLADVAARIVAIDAGESMSFGRASITAVASAHDEIEFDDRRYCRYLGFVVRVDGLTLYHSGDTRLHDGLAAALASWRPDVAPADQRQQTRAARSRQHGRARGGVACARSGRAARHPASLRHVRVQHRAARSL